MADENTEQGMLLEAMTAEERSIYYRHMSLGNPHRTTFLKEHHDDARAAMLRYRNGTEEYKDGFWFKDPHTGRRLVPPNTKVTDAEPSTPASARAHGPRSV